MKWDEMMWDAFFGDIVSNPQGRIGPGERRPGHQRQGFLRLYVENECKDVWRWFKMYQMQLILSCLNAEKITVWQLNMNWHMKESWESKGVPPMPPPLIKGPTRPKGHWWLIYSNLNKALFPWGGGIGGGTLRLLWKKLMPWNQELVQLRILHMSRPAGFVWGRYPRFVRCHYWEPPKCNPDTDAMFSSRAPNQFPKTLDQLLFLTSRKKMTQLRSSWQLWIWRDIFRDVFY